MKSNYILVLLVLISVTHSSVFDLYETISIADTFFGCQVSRSGESIFLFSQMKIYLYSKTGTALAQIQTIEAASPFGVGLTNDELTFVSADMSGRGIKVFKRNNTGSQFSLNQTIAASSSSFACINGDGDFFAFLQGSDMEIYSRNNAGTYDPLHSLSSGSTFMGCTFSEDGAFMFLIGTAPQLYKYNGSSFEHHQNIPQISSPGMLAKALFRSPYFIYPELDGDGNTNIRFFQHNTSTDQWDVAFQKAIADLSTFLNLDVSFDHKFIVICDTSNIFVEEGSIAEGYTRKSTIAQLTYQSRLSPINDLLIVPTLSAQALLTYINCNWNTSGNFYLNSNTSTCEQCVGCLICSAPDDCSQCDETSNYFHDGNQTCNLCNISNCLTCDSLTTCTACESGYEAQGNSACVQIPGSDDLTDDSTASEGSAALSTGQVIGIVIGVVALTGILSVSIFKIVSACNAKTTVPTDQMEESMGKIV